MMQKVVASEIFKDQKDSYPQSVGRLFLDSRLGTCSYRCTLINAVQITKSVITLRGFSPLLCVEREQINLKVTQTLGNDKVQVGLNLF